MATAGENPFFGKPVSQSVFDKTLFFEYTQSVILLNNNDSFILGRCIHHAVDLGGYWGFSHS
jgi:hypothetical protein